MCCVLVKGAAMPVRDVSGPFQLAMSLRTTGIQGWRVSAFSLAGRTGTAWMFRSLGTQGDDVAAGRRPLEALKYSG